MFRVSVNSLLVHLNCLSLMVVLPRFTAFMPKIDHQFLLPVINNNAACEINAVDLARDILFAANDTMKLSAPTFS